MIEAKRYYLARVKAGAKQHKSIENELGRNYGVSGKTVREQLIEGGYIQIVDQYKIHGKTFLVPAATGKELPEEEELPQATHSPYWEDGTVKSQNNWFNWREMSQGLFSRSEIANDRTVAYRGQN
jgi:hypothetical protein